MDAPECEPGDHSSMRAPCTTFDTSSKPVSYKPSAWQRVAWLTVELAIYFGSLSYMLRPDTVYVTSSRVKPELFASLMQQPASHNSLPRT